MRRLSLAILLSLCACGDDAPSSTGMGTTPGGSGAETTPSSAEGPSSGAATVGDGDATVTAGNDATTASHDDSNPDGSEGDDATAGTTGDEEPPVPACGFTCATPGDCIQPSPLYTPEHFECNEGVCEWQGCVDDGECQAAYANPFYRCGEVEGSSVPTCYQACPDDVAQCFLPSPLYDNDNWACNAGRCEWQGCVDDMECVQAFENGGYVCDTEGGGTPTCVGTCDDPTDCQQPSPLYDANNWACEDHRCRWVGCMGDMECMDAYMSGNAACDP